MLLRLVVLLIPVLTFALPQRWFTFYATIFVVVALVQIALIALLHEEYAQAFRSFGIEVVLAYLGVNVALLGVRYRLIRRARARITKLPAPK